MKKMLTVLALLALLPVSAEAALVSANEGVKIENTWNPQPMQDDIILPMPHGISMVFRAVAIPSGSFVQDTRISMGVSSAEDPARQFYDHRFDSYISASLQQKDLPQVWQSILPADEKEHYRYYFIGKYEISEYQWAAIMDENFSGQTSAQSDRPKTDISWYDVQIFLKKYNQWLLDNHPEMLPHFTEDAANIGFLRLPTEEEWEFAARGGNNVPPEDRNQEEIFPLNGAKLEDFGVFTTAESKKDQPSPIGSRKANPMGLFDTVGNVKEMVQGFFRMSVADRRGDEMFRRLHGSSGGILCKSGSFLSDSAEVIPGWRDEIPLYTTRGENRLTDVGFRPVLSGMNIPGLGRLKELSASSTNMLVGSAAGASSGLAGGAGASGAAGTTAGTSGGVSAGTTTGGTVGTSAGSSGAAGTSAGGAGGAGSVNVTGASQSGSAVSGSTVSGQTPSGIKINPQGSPVSELEKLIAVSSPEMKANLVQLRGMVADMATIQERQQEENIENTIRSLLYQEEALRNVAYRYWILDANYQANKKNLAKKDAQELLRTMSDFFEILQTSANYYKTSIQTLQDIPQETVNRHMRQFSKFYSGADIMSTHMTQNIKSLENHLVQIRKDGISSLTKIQICRDIIPEILYKALPF